VAESIGEQSVSSPLKGIMQKLAIYREFSKSGIVALVLISVLGGYLTGQSFEVPFSLPHLTTTLLSILLLASGSSALNQWQEKAIDAKMPRTANRPLPSGRMSDTEALTFIFTCLGIGTALLFLDSLEMGILGVSAVVSYNGLYTLWWKRKMPFAAVPGAIPGALPILMGHVASSRDLWSPGGWYLFAILFFWQMPHFWVLALKYSDDYRNGEIPTLPVSLGELITRKQITVWGLAYIGISMMAPLFIPVGNIYLISTVLVGFWVAIELFRYWVKPEGRSWLRFFLSINFSLVAYIGLIVIDLWFVHLIPSLTR
jgi:protoheme IX farnesyltransferase